MTQDEIIELARQAGLLPCQGIHMGDLKAFAKLVAEKEREVHRSYIYELERELEVTQDKLNECIVADYMKKARGQA
jgi:hypothetical protein